jgi:hypothetical protein
MVDGRFLRRLFGLDSSLLGGAPRRHPRLCASCQPLGPFDAVVLAGGSGRSLSLTPSRWLVSLPVCDGRVAGHVQVVDVTVFGTDGLTSRTLTR